MSSRKEKKPVLIDNKPVVGGIEAARILTERAKELSSKRVYSRDTIYKHYVNGTLKPAMETPAGNLYFVKDIEALPISPNLGKKSKDKKSKQSKA